MGAFKIQQAQHLQTRQESRLIARVEQANLLEMPEEAFHHLIAEIEKSPLFKKLHREEKIIRYQRFPRTDISSNFYQLKEEIVADEGSLDVESLLLSKEHVVRQIRRLGLEKFKRYFLYHELDMDVEDIARECDLEVSEVQKISSLIDEFFILSEFYNPSASGAEHGIYYSKIASVERGPEGFTIGYFSPSFARGRYYIDYERFEALRRNGTFSDAEAKEAKRILKKLELINIRKDTVTQILQGIVGKQALYFESGDLKALLPFSQKELAKKLGLVPSSISRAIRGKSLDTPWGEEKPLKDFFPRPRRFKRRLIRQLLEAETEPLSDEAIRGRLDKEFGVSISRRSVASLRKELKIPAAWKRGKNLPKKSEEG
jgi:DNA-directed RNA polymerase specialized sigma54-like protein